MPPWLLLTLYCIVIVLASLAGGFLPLVIRLTHRRLQIALSFVSGVMLGISLLHLLPHALIEQAAAAGPPGHSTLEPVLLWLLAGLLAMFVLERFFCFHHHEADGEGGPEPSCGHDHDHDHDDGHHDRHRLTWTGAAVGLTIHTLVAGMALAASVTSERHEQGIALAGLGTFLVIALHKPFDSLTLGALLAAGRHRRSLRHVVNVLFSLAVPIGAGLFLAGLASSGESGHGVLAAALAFSAGTFLCISLSDLLPELHFHRHDRVPLTVALLLGLAIAWGVARLEAAGHEDHGHDHQAETGVAHQH